MTFWPSAIIGFVIATILGIGIHELIVDNMEMDQAAAIQEQKTADIQECSKTTQPAIVSDTDALQSCNNNLNACDDLLQHQPATCVPVSINTSCTKTANLAAARLGITSTAITAHNLFCRNQIEEFNSAKTWAIQCLKNGTCQ